MQEGPSRFAGAVAILLALIGVLLAVVPPGPAVAVPLVIVTVIAGALSAVVILVPQVPKWVRFTLWTIGVAVSASALTLILVTRYLTG